MKARLRKKLQKKLQQGLNKEDLWERTINPFTGRPDHFVLIGQTPVPCSLREWATVSLPNDRRVRLTQIGPFEVSTVFLGLDHNHLGDGPPLLFETMTFLKGSITDKLRDGSFESNDCDGRWSTWDEAERGHQLAVDFLRANYCSSGEEPIEITDERASTGT